MTARLIIWDVDGTLIDSRTLIQAAMEHAFRAMQLVPPPYEATRQIVGLSLIEGCRRLAPEDFGVARLEQLVAAYRDAFAHLHGDVHLSEQPYEGALDVLADARRAGWRMGIATGKTQRGLRRVFDRYDIESCFDTIWCADDGPGKPHPFMIEQALRATGIAPASAVMVGDAVFDMQMGRAAGVRTHGVSWGFGTGEELQSAGADELHHDFASLRAGLGLGAA